ncbi:MULTISPECIES: hypothetical protein [Sorangium]|nr:MULTISPECIES: hypothetical protein [Sorangium]
MRQLSTSKRGEEKAMNMIDLDEVARRIESLIGTGLPSIVSDAMGDALDTLQWTGIPIGVEDDGAMANLLGLASLAPDTELVVVADPCTMRVYTLRRSFVLSDLS